MKTDPLAQLRTGAPLTTRQQMSLTLIPSATLIQDGVFAV